MTTILEKFAHFSRTPSDIYQHLPTLKEYSDKCSHVTEMGVRNVVSTYAFLASSAKTVIGYDIETQPQVAECQEIAKKEKRDWKFIEADVLKVEIEETDFLFIDTFHSALQLSQELALHADKVRKYIGFHDVFTFWEKPEPAYDSAARNHVDGKEGLKYALEPFLANNPQWKVVYRTDANNGLMIIERIA